VAGTLSGGAQGRPRRDAAWPGPNFPPYERAAPPDILDRRLFGGLPKDDPDLHLLDETLHDWLAARCMDMDPERHAEYGLSRFVTETMGALSSASWVCPAAALGFRTASWS